MGFRPLPHSKHQTGGMVFPDVHIKAIREAEQRELERFDTQFDLPEHLTPEFPPPIFLTTRPDLGDVSQGEVLTTPYSSGQDGLWSPSQQLVRQPM